MTNEQFIREYYPRYKRIIKRRASGTAYKYGLHYLENDFAQEGLMALLNHDLGESSDEGILMRVVKDAIGKLLRRELRQITGSYPRSRKQCVEYTAPI